MTLFQNQLLIGEPESKMFSCVKEMKVESGSSPSLQYLRHGPSMTLWVAKCSGSGIVNQREKDWRPNMQKPTDPINEYREALSLKLYSIFQITTPQTILLPHKISPHAMTSYQPLITKILQNYPPLSPHLNLSTPRIHILSRFIQSYQPLGNNFLHENSNTKEYQYVEKGKVIVGDGRGLGVVGFGRALAVGIFLYDYDCFGRDGGNMGYVVQGGQAVVVKIDAGEALPFLDDMENSPGIRHHPETRDMILNTKGTKISFSQLTQPHKKQFLQTITQILSLKDEQLIQLFQPFIKLDNRFQIILKKLLSRKGSFLMAFSEEVRQLLRGQLVEIQEMEAERIYGDWGTGVYVAGRRREVIEGEAILNTYQLRESNNHFQVPRPNTNFVGREKYLAEIKSTLDKQRNVFICGSGGIGKTELATQYLSKSKYTTKIWLHSQHKFALTQIKTYLNTLHPQSKQLKTSTQILQYFYSKISEDTCIVFDNLANQQQYKLLTADNKRAHVIVTSRFKNWERRGKIQVGGFSSREVRMFVQGYFGKESSVMKEEVEILGELVEGFPLGVLQACAYMKQNKCSVVEYCEKYKADSDYMLLTNSNQGVNASVFTTIVLTLNSAKQRDPLTDEIISTVAFLSPDHITQSLLQRHLKKPLSKSLQLLASYSILSLVSHYYQTTKIKIHRLIQSTSIMIQKKNKIFDHNLRISTDWVISELSVDENHVSFADDVRIFKAIPQGLVITEILMATVKEKNLGEWGQKISDLYLEIGKHHIKSQDDNSWIFLQKSLSIVLKIYRADHLKIGYIYYLLIFAHKWAENYKKMLFDTQKALQIFKNHLGQEHRISIKTLHFKGEALLLQGQYSTAEKILKKCAKLSEKVFGQSHFITGNTYRTLANVYGFLNEFQEKERLLRKVLEVYKRYYGEQDYQTMATLSTYYLDKMSDLQKKVILESRILELKDDSSTGVDIEIAEGKTMLGSVCYGLGEYEKSRMALQQSLSIRENKIDPFHPSLVQTLLFLGLVNFQLNSNQQSKLNLYRALHIQIQFHGDQDDPLLIDTYTLLGNYHAKVGQVSKSIQFLSKSLKILRNLPKTDPFQAKLQSVFLVLADLNRSQHNYPSSLQCYRKILQLKLTKNSYNHKSLIYEYIGNTYGLMGEQGRRELFLMGALRLRRLIKGTDRYGRLGMDKDRNEGLGNCYLNLSYVELELGHLEKALEFGRQAYQNGLMQKSALGTKNVDLALKQIKIVEARVEKLAKSHKKIGYSNCKYFKQFKNLPKKIKHYLQIQLNMNQPTWNRLPPTHKLFILIPSPILFSTLLTSSFLANLLQFFQIQFQLFILRQIYRNWHLSSDNLERSKNTDRQKNIQKEGEKEQGRMLMEIQVSKSIGYEDWRNLMGTFRRSKKKGKWERLGFMDFPNNLS